MDDESRSPILDHGPTEKPVFLPGNLLEGERRQKGPTRTDVPGG